MKTKIQLFLLLTLFTLSVWGQETDTTRHKEIIEKRAYCLLTGISIGKYTFAEIGISKNCHTVWSFASSSYAYFASTELKLGDKFIIGPKVGMWIAGCAPASMAFGVNMIYYSDFDNGSLVFRPEFGIGFDKFKIVYGYNAILTKYKLGGINRNLGSLVYCFKLKRLKDKIINR